MAVAPGKSSDTTTSLWIAHHWPEHYDRCISVGRVHLCRRCAVLYPLVVVTAAVALLTDPSASAATAAMWLLPLPMLLDWTGEHADLIRYSPTRQVLVTAVAAPAFGVALARHLVSPFTLGATLPIIAYVAVLFAVVLWSGWRSVDAEPVDWESEHEQAERERAVELQRLLDAADESIASRHVADG